MKCPNCNSEFEIKLASKILANKCKVLTAITTIATVQCDNCKKILQVPISSKSFISVKDKD